jgi:hypothetical protein
MAAGSLLAVAACSHAAAVSPTTAASQPTTTTSTSTTAPPTYGSFPLTGLPVHDPTKAGRPALSIKVDDAAPARPQTGLDAADLVTEELVEGGLTRFFVTFQSQDADVVGPVRSARPVDADLLSMLGGGLFAYSGAAAGEIAPVINHSGAVLLSDEHGDPGFHRDWSRPAPYNLYVSTPALYQVGTRKPRPPAPQVFSFSSSAPGGAGPARTVSLPFSDRSASGWTWTGTRYERVQDGSPATLSDGSPVTATNVLILSVSIRGTGIFDTAHEEDPFVVVTGTGTCWLMRDGVMVQGTFHRPSSASPMTLTGPGGEPLQFHPGRTWIELLPVRSSPGFGN